MFRNKKMTITFIVVALVLIGLVTAAWWHVFFGTVNPPLPQATVVVQSPTSSANSSSVVASNTASTSTPGASAASAPIVAGENPPLAEEQLSIDGATFNVEIASTMLEQARGLSFRPSLSAHAGMLFLFGGSGSVQSFWMKDMNFPLDMIWISGNTVAGFAQNVPAPASGAPIWSLPVYTSPDSVDKVLEVNAGTVAKYNIKAGDAVTIGAIK
jgi:uncharacterized membrane protein (UPF0127 family)